MSGWYWMEEATKPKNAKKPNEDRAGRNANETRKRGWAVRTFGPYVLAAGLAGGAVGLAVGATGCDDGNNTQQQDAGVQCTESTNDAGDKICLPADKCELAFVEDGKLDSGVVQKTQKCVPKTASDAGVEKDAKEDLDAKIDLDAKQEDTAKPQEDAKVDLDAPVEQQDAGVVCTVNKKVRAYVTLGKRWIVGGQACNVNGSPSKVDDGDTLKRSTGVSTTESCMATATPALVKITCPSGEYQGSASGCTHTTPLQTEVCNEEDRVLVTGNTKVNDGLNSRSLVRVYSLYGNDTLYLKDDGTSASTKNLGTASQQIVATLKSLGVGDDGMVVVAGKVVGPADKSSCGDAVSAAGAVIGDVLLANVVSMNDVRGDSVFHADFSAGGNAFTYMPEGGSPLNFGGDLVAYQGTVVNGQNGGVVLKEAAGQQRTCALTVGQNTSSACNQMYGGMPVTLNLVYHENPCNKPSP